MSTESNGRVYLVGAVRCSDLLTLRGRALIEQADCLVYDALVSPALLAWAKPSCKKVYVGKRSGNHALPQAQINSLLVQCAAQYPCTVRLKGGDPYVFGRGAEEASALFAAGVHFEVVPVSARPLPAPPMPGFPLLTVLIVLSLPSLPGMRTPVKVNQRWILEGIASAKGTKIMLMGMSRLAETMARLIAAGQRADEPAAAIQWAATARQRRVIATVATLADAVEQAGLGARP